MTALVRSHWCEECRRRCQKCSIKTQRERERERELQRDSERRIHSLKKGILQDERTKHRVWAYVTGMWSIGNNLWMVVHRTVGWWKGKEIHISFHWHKFLLRSIWKISPRAWNSNYKYSTTTNKQKKKRGIRVICGRSSTCPSKYGRRNHDFGIVQCIVQYAINSH